MQVLVMSKVQLSDEAKVRSYDVGEHVDDKGRVEKKMISLDHDMHEL